MLQAEDGPDATAGWRTIVAMRGLSRARSALLRPQIAEYLAR